MTDSFRLALVLAGIVIAMYAVATLANWLIQ